MKNCESIAPTLLDHISENWKTIHRYCYMTNQDRGKTGSRNFLLLFILIRIGFCIEGYYAAAFFSTRTAFTPPKPKELVIATSIEA